ncbi:hypothetical protein [Aureimonas pseudogalii]|uniref:Uncharacterized protein n=1 Tax=Aureimonas pseudogalii TaxID=1744844 RepID=A0A7W6E9K1_9HYPH|nr:hypothetical protein [Aureimonas pseudogalii]MBB3997255.1 hypothetical protein [Aureimonas pseudogalii]
MSGILTQHQALYDQWLARALETVEKEKQSVLDNDPSEFGVGYGRGYAHACQSIMAELVCLAETFHLASLRSDREPNVQTMTDAELVAELNRCAFHFDRRGEHGGSPGEYWAERAMEIETLQRRRAAVSENPEPTP